MKLFLTLFLFMSIVVVSRADEHLLSPLPMKIGEKMIFTIRILGIVAGEQTIEVYGYTNFNGERLVYGGGRTYTIGIVHRMYKMADRDITFMNPDTLAPVYNERIVHEGKWNDHLWFNYMTNKVKYRQLKDHNRLHVVEFSGLIHSFYTMIAYLRSLDYDYYIESGKKIRFNYMFGNELTKTEMVAKYKTIYTHRKKKQVIDISEIGGQGYHFTILDDEDRRPLKLIIPSYNIPAFKRVDFVIELKKFIRGCQYIGE